MKRKRRMGVTPVAILSPWVVDGQECPVYLTVKQARPLRDTIKSIPSVHCYLYDVKEEEGSDGENILVFRWEILVDLPPTVVLSVRVSPPHISVDGTSLEHMIEFFLNTERFEVNVEGTPVRLSGISSGYGRDGAMLFKMYVDPSEAVLLPDLYDEFVRTLNSVLTEKLKEIDGKRFFIYPYNPEQSYAVFVDVFVDVSPVYIRHYLKVPVSVSSLVNMGMEKFTSPSFVGMMLLMDHEFLTKVESQSPWWFFRTFVSELLNYIKVKVPDEEKEKVRRIIEMEKEKLEGVNGVRES